MVSPAWGEFSREENYEAPEEAANFYFTNQYRDKETGLYYYGARYYNPEIGRFITADTIVQDPENSVTFNRYHYSANNPVNYIDPDGHGFWKSFIGGIVGATAFVASGGLSNAVIAGFWGGLIGGATTGALNNGLKGAFSGALMGGVLGSIGGAAKFADNFTGNLILGGLFASGVATTAESGEWGSFAGGFAGSIVGTLAANGFANAREGQPGYDDDGVPLGGGDLSDYESDPLTDNINDVNENNQIEATQQGAENVALLSEDTADRIAGFLGLDRNAQGLEGAAKNSYNLATFFVGGIAKKGAKWGFNALKVGITSKYGLKLFGKGGLLNKGPNLRFGIGRHKGFKFRVAGDWIKKYGWTKKMRLEGKIDLFDLGK